MNVYLISHRLRRTCRPLAVGLLVFGFAALRPRAVQAFVFQENPNNSLDNFQNRPGDPLTGGATVLIVTPGVNVASGAFTCQTFSCRDDFDSFRMEVPAGFQITLTEPSLMACGLIWNPKGSDRITFWRSRTLTPGRIASN